jgi:hypothetical protein
VTIAGAARPPSPLRATSVYQPDSIAPIYMLYCFNIINIVVSVGFDNITIKMRHSAYGFCMLLRGTMLLL